MENTNDIQLKPIGKNTIKLGERISGLDGVGCKINSGLNFIIFVQKYMNYYIHFQTYMKLKKNGIQKKVN